MATSGRILDKDFEEGLSTRAKELRREAERDIEEARKFAYKKNDEIEAVIREHPKSFVFGAFIGGVALGALLARGNK